MTHLSTFSGIGGIDLAAHWAGFRTVAFCEIDPFCQRVLARHWPGVPIYDDIRTLTAESLFERGIERVDLLSGGFPCQPFSLAGKRKGRDDERFLFPELLRVIREVAPVFVLLENVPGLLSIAIDEVVESVEGAGYTVFPPLVFEAADVGAPHGRERVFIVAHTDQGRGDGTGFQPEQAGWGEPENGRGELANTERGGQSWGLSGVGSGGGAACGERNKQADGLAGPGAAVVELGHPPIGGIRRGDAPRQGGFAPLADEAMADPERGDGAGWASEPGRGPEGRVVPAGTGEAVRYADGGRCEEREECNGHAAQDTAHWNPRRGDIDGSGGAEDASGCAESRLGGNPDGLPGRMDVARWPAPLGPEQYEWEPPRLCGKIPDRAARLKALGNAVCPQQVYPVLAGIAACLEESR